MTRTATAATTQNQGRLRNPSASVILFLMKITAKEINDYGDAKCSCCGRAHRKMHRMSDGTVMGSTCAQRVENLTEGGATFRAHFLKIYSASSPNSPALRFAQ